MGKYDSILMNFNYPKDGFEFWYKELFEITVEYFEEHVLPLLSYMSYSETENIYILTHGFRNILYQTKAERALSYDYGLLTSQVLKSLQRSPLDKTNIELKLFGAFL